MNWYLRIGFVVLFEGVCVMGVGVVSLWVGLFVLFIDLEFEFVIFLFVDYGMVLWLCMLLIWLWGLLKELFRGWIFGGFVLEGGVEECCVLYGIGRWCFWVVWIGRDECKEFILRGDLVVMLGICVIVEKV